MDLAALARLVQWSGACGRRVVVSSATVSRQTLAFLLQAYEAGWEDWVRFSGAPAQLQIAYFGDAPGALFTATAALGESQTVLNRGHQQYAKAMLAALAKAPIRRKASLLCLRDLYETSLDNPQQPLQETQKAWSEALVARCLALHRDHFVTLKPEDRAAQDAQSGKTLTLSVGAVRVANIGPCRDLARHIATQGVREGTLILALCYHARLSQAVRQKIEALLEASLKRKDPGVFAQSELVALALAQAKAQNVTDVAVVIVATPVIEVGRDLDLDWALVEPSSVRAIVQLAGRVRRHRPDPISQPNVALLGLPWRAFENKKKRQKEKVSALYAFPGPETPMEFWFSPTRKEPRCLTEIAPLRVEGKTGPLLFLDSMINLKRWEEALTAAPLLAEAHWPLLKAERQALAVFQTLPPPSSAPSQEAGSLSSPAALVQAWQTDQPQRLMALVPDIVRFRQGDQDLLLMRENRDWFQVQWGQGPRRAGGKKGPLRSRLPKDPEWVDLGDARFWLLTQESLEAEDGLLFVSCPRRFDSLSLEYHPLLGLGKNS